MDDRADESLDPQLASLVEHSGVPAGIGTAVRKPAGARFYKCALQVNPFAYTTRHAKQNIYTTEEEYNTAIVAACLKEGVEIVGITDHFRIAASHTLSDALSAAGIDVLLGLKRIQVRACISCVFFRVPPRHMNWSGQSGRVG